MFIESFMQFFGTLFVLFQLFQQRDFIMNNIDIVLDNNILIQGLHHYEIELAINPSDVYFAG